ncbi:MAG: winged helix-turn-helix domain-containing protein [Burkholderiales bacterium]|nr:winged helix-turn-helix domain-containing protein [Burkholderiales bacterium]
MSVPTYRFLDCTLEPALRQLTRAGAPLAVGERAFDLLAHLLAHAGRVVSRDEVMQAVWGDAVVGDNNLNVQVAALRSLLGRAAVLTVPGRGLRFGHAVRAEVQAEEAPGLPDRPSVAILPFTDLSADARWSWLADSIVEDITTELSRFRDLFVVARNSAFGWRGEAKDIRAVARALGVRYVVEGSVRVAGTDVRTTAQLIDAASGGHVWAENVSGTLDDPFAAQTRIAAGVVTALAPQIDAAESMRMRRAPPLDLSAYGLAQAGWAIVSAGEMAFDRAPRDRALQLAQQALAADPACNLAHRVVAATQWWHAYHGTTDDFGATVAAGIAAADAAIGIDAQDHHAWRQKGLLAFMAQDVAAGLAALRHAHALNPNCAVTLAWLGLNEMFHGEASRAVGLVEAALRLSPRDPARGEMLCALGFAQFAACDYVGAAASAHAASLGMANAAPPLVLGAIARIGAGDLAGGQASYTALAATAPALAAERLAGRWLSTNPGYQRRALTFLRVAAGLAPPEAADALR